jgi:hypothetical protein
MEEDIQGPEEGKQGPEKGKQGPEESTQGMKESTQGMEEDIQGMETGLRIGRALFPLLQLLSRHQVTHTHRINTRSFPLLSPKSRNDVIRNTTPCETLYEVWVKHANHDSPTFRKEATRRYKKRK